MIILSTDHHRTVRDLGSTESQWSACADQIAREHPDTADHLAGDCLSRVSVAPECPHRRRIGEYKIMGLAPYGEPRFAQLILDRLIDLKEDGFFRTDMSYFNYCQGLTMASRRFDDLFGGPPRQPESPPSQKEMDIAASIQSVTEEIMLRSARHVHRETGLRRLCLAGGVALNCVGKGRILREGPSRTSGYSPRLVTPEAHWALRFSSGISFSVSHGASGSPTSSRARCSPSYDAEDIRSFLHSVGATYHEFTDDESLCERGR
jgi:carbamoyltransferase